jgi:hypothetical protein
MQKVKVLYKDGPRIKIDVMSAFEFDKLRSSSEIINMADVGEGPIENFGDRADFDRREEDFHARMLEGRVIALANDYLLAPDAVFDPDEQYRYLSADEYTEGLSHRVIGYSYIGHDVGHAPALEVAVALPDFAEMVRATAEHSLEYYREKTFTRRFDDFNNDHKNFMRYGANSHRSGARTLLIQVAQLAPSEHPLAEDHFGFGPNWARVADRIITNLELSE